uniref:Tpd52 like 2a n=1 Tax=Neolamprologus brichardi TaxID=32507 RepID=A0A3Q4GLH5_NEOBR
MTIFRGFLFFFNLIQDMRDASTWSGNRGSMQNSYNTFKACNVKKIHMAKEQYAADIRRQLGMSPLGNIKQSLSKGWQEVQTSAPYVRTRDSLSHAGHVTSAAMSSVGVVITRRLAQMRYTHSHEQKNKSYTDCAETQNHSNNNNFICIALFKTQGKTREETQESKQENER